MSVKISDVELKVFKNCKIQFTDILLIIIMALKL